MHNWPNDIQKTINLRAKANKIKNVFMHLHRCDQLLIMVTNPELNIDGDKIKMWKEQEGQNWYDN